MSIKLERKRKAALCRHPRSGCAVHLVEPVPSSVRDHASSGLIVKRKRPRDRQAGPVGHFHQRGAFSELLFTAALTDTSWLDG